MTIPILIFAALLAGCSTPVPLRVTLSETGLPVADVSVERHGPVTRWEKISNPVGAFYFPYRHRETVVTDVDGRGVLRKVGRKDFLEFTSPTNENITVVLGSETVFLESGPSPETRRWVKREDGEWRGILPINVDSHGPVLQVK